MTLPPQMEAMGQYRQFINWRLEERPGETKPAKVPFNPVKGSRVDPMHFSSWMTKQEAEELAAKYGCGIGFVLTENDPLFCVDLDGCIHNGKWTDFGNTVAAMLPGALIEISQSGNSAHVWGYTSVKWPHRTRNKNQPGLEVYTKERFIALTGNIVCGELWLDQTTNLQTVVGTFLPGEPTEKGTFAWNDGPVPEWQGYTDDGQLLQKMLTSMSTKAQFGGSCSVQALWNADDDVLAAHYPPDGNKPEAFNHSSADAALCAHLAFWTGKDCTRMEHLFSLSALGQRDKWVEREDYRERTILNAVANCQSVYGQNDLQSASQPPQDVNPTPQATMQAESTMTAARSTGLEPVATQGIQYMTANQQAEFFSGMVYVKSSNKVYCPNGEAYDQSQFNAMFGGYEFQMRADNTKPAKQPWEAFLGNQMMRFPKVHHWCFRPEVAPWQILHEDSRSLLNAFIPSEIDAMPGDVSPFLQHIEKLFPDQRDRQIILSYAAACVQYQGHKFQWTPVIQGIEGNGKTLIGECLIHAIGERNCHVPDASKLGGQFNGWIERKLFILVEELYVGHKLEVMNKLKPLITNRRIPIEAKHVNEVTGDNRANFLCCSNFKTAVLKTKRDRRYAPFFTPQQEFEDLATWGMDGEYFPRLYHWLKEQNGYRIVAHYLLSYQIPDEFNPAGLCHRAPQTSSTEEAIKESVGGVESVILEAIEEGEKGFKNGWISSVALSQLLDRKRMGHRLTPRAFPGMLKGLGYMPHPALPGGRLTMPVDNGKRPVLYIAITSPNQHLQTAQQIADRYLTDNDMGPAQVFDGVPAAPTAR